MPNSTAIVITYAGSVSVAAGSSASFVATWGNLISAVRWTRVWAAVAQASDEDIAQTMFTEGEGSEWDSNDLRVQHNVFTLRAQSRLGTPVQARVHIMASQTDTF